MKRYNYPLVSIVMICYNQEKYIAQAIDGILNQNYDGEIELIIANDRSKDSTDEIIQDKIKNHINGSWIKYTNHEVNKGMMENIRWALQQASGSYVALCEGDDYWTTPSKISKQISFLEKNKSYYMVFHNAKTINYSEDFAMEFPHTENREYSINEAYQTWMIPTASIVFKQELVKDIVSNLKDKRVFNWDIILILTCFSFGKVRGMEETMSDYRFGDSGLSILRMKNNKIEYLKNNLHHHSYIKEKFISLDRSIFSTKFFHIHMELGLLYKNKGSVRCVYHYLMAWTNRPLLSFHSILKLLKFIK